MQYDYILVGQGLAGSLLAFKLLQANKKIIVFDNASQDNNASKISSGMYNAVILKRFTKIWRAEAQTEEVLKTFKQIETFFNEKLQTAIPIYRIFHDKNEIETWQNKINKNHLESFLNNTKLDLNNPNIIAPNGLGEIYSGGKVLVNRFLELMANYLIQEKALRHEKFNYNALEITTDHIIYQEIKAKRIVFAEGYGIIQNPYFNYLPMEGNKGEILWIRAENLNLKAVLKSAIFIMPWQQPDHYFVGATYDWNTKNAIPTTGARDYLCTQLQKIIQSPFEIINHQAGIRPTITDRRPLLGQHPKYKPLYVLNGLGTRGILLGCDMAQCMFDYLENNKPLPPEAAINRKSILKKLNYK